MPERSPKISLSLSALVVLVCALQTAYVGLVAADSTNCCGEFQNCCNGECQPSGAPCRTILPPTLESSDGTVPDGSCCTVRDVPARCKQEPFYNPQTCKPIELVRWSFNPYSGKCESFSWTQCGKNDNHFETEARCKRSCPS